MLVFWDVYENTVDLNELCVFLVTSPKKKYFDQRDTRYFQQFSSLVQNTGLF